jgi:hypothetical protein
MRVLISSIIFLEKYLDDANSFSLIVTERVVFGEL